MSASIGTARHRYSDGSEHQLRVVIAGKGAPGFAAAIGEPNIFHPRDLDPDATVYIAGARQARALANYCLLLAERLEAKGDL